jgi:intraflagellar transport protein 172
VALALCPDSIFAGGSDMKIFIYEKLTGKVRQQFDFSKDTSNSDFSCASATATGQTVVFGALNKLKMFHYQSRRKVWEEGKTKKIENLYVPTALEWRKDGTFLSVATCVGTFHLFEAAYKLVNKVKKVININLYHNCFKKAIQE